MPNRLRRARCHRGLLRRLVHDAVDLQRRGTRRRRVRLRLRRLPARADPLRRDVADAPGHAVRRHHAGGAVPFNDTPWFGKALDAGAQGVIVPMVNSRADAEQAAAAAHYPPARRAQLRTRALGDDRRRRAGGGEPRVLCLVMIETAEAVERAEEICSTPGVDGIYIGPADLAISLGIGLAEMFEAPVHSTQSPMSARFARWAIGLIPGIHTGGAAGTRPRGRGASGCAPVELMRHGSARCPGRARCGAGRRRWPRTWRCGSTAEADAIGKV